MALSLFSHISHAQILNANFEDWEVDYVMNYVTGPETIYKPSHWSKFAKPEFHELFNFYEHSAEKGKSLNLFTTGLGTFFEYRQSSMFVYGKADSLFFRTYNRWLYDPKKAFLAGISFQKRPRYFGGLYIQWQKTDQDTTLAQVILRKYNTTTNKSDTVGIGKKYLTKTTEGLTKETPFMPFVVEIDYKSFDNPDTISIVLASNKKLPEVIINEPERRFNDIYTLKSNFSQLIIDSLYLSDRVMNIEHFSHLGMKVWYSKETTGGSLYIDSERDMLLNPNIFNSIGTNISLLPLVLNIKSGLNKFYIPIPKSNEILHLQLIEPNQQKIIGNLKLY
jgi:hypothetical protein